MHLSGSSPLGMYKKLVEFCNRGELSFNYVKTFNMDEYVGLPRDHPESYHSFMWDNFFKHIDIDPKNVHILDGNAEDLDAECDNYEEKITQAGGVDLFIGGMRAILRYSLLRIKYAMLLQATKCFSATFRGLELS